MSRRSRKPWDKRESETATAYGAFVTYLELGPDRTLLAAYRSHRDKPDAQHVGGHFTRWSSSHDWVRRAQAHDTAELQATIDARFAARERARQRYIEKLDRLVDTELAIALGVDEEGDAVQAPMTQVVTLKNALARAGLVETSKLEHTGPDGGPINVHAIGALDRAAADAIGDDLLDDLIEKLEAAEAESE